MALPTLRLPDNPRPSSYKITKQSNVLSSAPIVGAHRMQTRLIGEDYHSVELSYDPMSREEFAPLATFLNGLQGQHTQFSVLVPNFAKGDVLGQGNYLSLSNGRCLQVQDTALSLAFNEFTNSTNPTSNETFSNSFPVTAGVPVAIYFNLKGQPTDSVISLHATDATGGGTQLSNGFTVNAGRNLAILTPSSTQNVYARIYHATTASVTGMEIREGQSLNDFTMVPAPGPADAGSFVMPGSAAVMPCSLTGNGVSVTYGRDSFIRVKLNLMERQL